MENSFFEYRDGTGVGSESDSEVIDNSMVMEESFSSKKKPTGKNQTVFVAESEESSTDDDSEGEPNIPKVQVTKSSLAEAEVICSSDDDASKRSSNKQESQLQVSFNNVVLSSSDEEQGSPELLPKRRPPVRQKSSDSEKSIIGRKMKKRIFIDSDTDNSVIIEHEKQNKLKCLKDTPLRIEVNKAEIRKSTLNNSNMDLSDNDDENESCDEESDDNEHDKHTNKGVSHHTRNKKSNRILSDESGEETDEHDVDTDKDNISHDDSDAEENQPDEEESDGPDEDQMVMSRATRMSIMGVIPKGIDIEDSDDSDFIQSDEKSGESSTINSLNDLPDVTIDSRTPKKKAEDADSSRLTCSPFASPLHDITNELNQIEDSYDKQQSSKQNELKSRVLSNLQKSLYSKSNIDDDKSITNESRKSLPLVAEFKSPVLPAKSVKATYNKENEKVIDDDVTIIDREPEIIALSSDDEDEVTLVKTERSPKKSIKSEPVKKDGTMRQYVVPPSYPGQVTYVKKEVRERELAKLNGLKEDLQSVKYLLESMELETLPDGGGRLIERLGQLERQVREQGQRVANMLVQQESEAPLPAPGAREPTWEELQKASNAVQPRMFGKQAMATHMAERNMILDRLRDLHESLASRPAESEVAEPPKALKSTLMLHQLHALQWLRWRETQRPPGGILADDMGLGKTITMIALIIGDKEMRAEDEDDDDDSGRSSKLAKGGTLVVCPASLMQQWAAEVTKHCRPHAASVCLHHGAARATHPHRLATTDIVVTTYNILQRDLEKNGVLMKVLWRRVILDEAHIVRNHKAATSQAVSALKGRRRWCLTGTPVQNKDLDLFALLKFLRCTPFDELTMWKKWIDNKSMGGQERMSTIMRCILLRRTKQQLQQRGQLTCLPPRTEELRKVALTNDEMNVYQKVLVFSKTLFAQFLHQRAEKNADSWGAGAGSKDTEYHKMHKKMIALQGAKPVKSHEILVLLLRLRQVCCHCGLIAAMLDEDSADLPQDDGGQDLLAELNKLSLEDDRARKNGIQEEEKEVEEPEQEGTTVAEAIRSVMAPNNPVFELTRQSSKIKAVMECLKENVFSTKDDKAVVVSQWTSVLRLVGAELAAAGVACVTLSGAVPVPARAPLVAALNDASSDVRVMLLSLCAGGVGLNLCGASHLLLLDPHWNPQLEQQAQDRIYRVGQAKPVRIYRFMCVDTVEQSIRKLQEVKLELAESVLTGARNQNASKLSIEDLKMLFNMGQTQAQP